MSINDDDRVILCVAAHEARKLAASVRSLGRLVEDQHYSQFDGDPLEHIAALLDRVASLAGDGCGLYKLSESTVDGSLLPDGITLAEVHSTMACGLGGGVHGGPVRLRMFPRVNTKTGKRVEGDFARIWACEDCWGQITGGPK